jgi:hypothetical protein
VKYHCYIGAYESVYDFDVEAESPEEAAAVAAGRCHISGEWTVIPGEPVRVDVTERRSYEAALEVPTGGLRVCR